MSENQKPHVDQTAPNADVQGENQTTSNVEQTNSSVEALGAVEQTKSSIDASGLEDQHKQEMSDVLANINNDIEAGVQDGLSQEEIAERKKQAQVDERVNKMRKKTLGDNASRVANNGFNRFIAISAITAVVALGAGTLYFASGDDTAEGDMQGSVDLPKANVSGNATLTKEQAEFARQEQQQQAQNAQANGETYVPPVIVERDADQQYLVGDGVVPGVRVNVDENGRPVNNNNSFADAGLDPALANNGGMAVSASDGTRNVANNVNGGANQAQGGYQQNNEQQQQAPIVPTIAQDRYAGGIQNLENAGKNAENWQNGIADNWIKRASQTEEVAQTAFEQQFLDLLSTKPKRDAASVGNSNRHVQYNYSAKTSKQGAKSSSTTSGKSNDPQNYSVGNTSGNNGSNSADGQQKKVYIRAGSTYITQLVSEVNTDEGVEVMGRISSGPYKGAQILGQVRQANKDIQFVFTRLIPKTGPELRIDAVAREIGTNKLGMADDIKTHTFKRYAGMVLASGMQGYGEAWSEIGTSTTTAFGTVQTKEKPNDREIGGRIVGQMGQSVSQDILKQTQRPTTYITYSGKVFNLYFNKNVTEQENN